MGDGTEPRGDDLLDLAAELYNARQMVARLSAENTALRKAWVRVSNFDRHDFANGVDQLLNDFMKKCSARLALDDAKQAGGEV